MSTTVDPRLEAIRKAAQAEFARAPKAQPWWLHAALLVGVNLVVGAVLALGFSVNHEQHSSEALRWLGGLGLIAISVVGAIAAVRPGWQGVRLGVLLGALATMLVMLAAASGLGPFGGVACGAIETVASLVPVVASVLVLSRFAPDPWRTMVGGLSAGTGGLFALHFHCPNGGLAHLTLFHLLPWLLVCLAAIVLRRLVRTDSWAP